MNQKFKNGKGINTNMSKSYYGYDLEVDYYNPRYTEYKVYTLVYGEIHEESDTYHQDSLYIKSEVIKSYEEALTVTWIIMVEDGKHTVSNPIFDDGDSLLSFNECSQRHMGLYGEITRFIDTWGEFNKNMVNCIVFNSTEVTEESAKEDDLVEEISHAQEIEDTVEYVSELEQRIITLEQRINLLSDELDTKTDEDDLAMLIESAFKNTNDKANSHKNTRDVKYNKFNDGLVSNTMELSPFYTDYKESLKNFQDGIDVDNLILKINTAVNNTQMKDKKIDLTGAVTNPNPTNSFSDAANLHNESLEQENKILKYQLKLNKNENDRLTKIIKENNISLK